MVYELSNWSNTATAADVPSHLITRRSRTRWPRAFRASTTGGYIYRAQQNVYRYSAKRELVGAVATDLDFLHRLLCND